MSNMPPESDEEKSGRQNVDATPKKDTDAKNADDDHVSDLAEDGKAQEETVSFNSLNAVEKEVLAKKLRKEILKDTERTEMCCYTFLDWVFEQFQYVKADPPSTVLFSNLEYINKHCKKPELFVREGSQEATSLYLDCISNSVEPDYASDDLDVYSLANATVKYVRERVEFLDSELYERLSEVHENDGERDFVMRRMPFVVKNRDSLIGIKDLFERMGADESESGVTRSKMAEVWADAVVKRDSDQETTDPIGQDQKTEILESLLGVDFTYVPIEFYH